MQAAAARLSGAGPRARLLLGLGAGGLAGLGQVPFSLVPVALAGLVLSLALLAAAPGGRAAFATGWATGAGYFLVTLHWIVEPFLVDVARHGWMAPFALIFLCAGLALFWGAAYAAARALAPGGWGLALGWAAALSLVEALRGHLLTGFPWALPGYIWTEGPGLQLVAWLGSYGLTFVTLLLVGAGWRLAQAPPRWAPAVLLIPWLVPLGLGALAARPDAVPGDAPVVRLVQPNAEQHLKWQPDWAPLFFQRQLDFTAAPPLQGGPGAPDLVIWPETSIPWRLDEGDSALARIAAASPAPVLLGAVRLDGLQAYNSAALIGAGGRIEALYDKHHLVPFGEYLPLGGVTKFLGLPSFGRRDGYGFMPGPGPRLIDLGPLGRALPLICYEAIFPRDVNGAPERPDLLVQLTNDAWFGTFAGPQQHLAQARARAVEQGLPLIRVANTGISAVIDAGGQVSARLGLGEAAWHDAAVPPARAPTPYARSGDWPWFGLPIVVLLALFARKRRQGVDLGGRAQ